jgi:5'-nucleotidase
MAAPPRSAVNLNVPALPRSEIKGVRWAKIAPFGAVRAAVGSRSDHQVEFKLEPTDYVPGPDTDQGCVNRGYAALTTLVGVVEAWPSPADGLGPVGDIEASASFVPGADLHPVHQVPDAADHRLLRRPGLGV